MLSFLPLLSGCWKTVVKTEYVPVRPPVELVQLCEVSPFAGKTVNDLVQAKLRIDDEVRACNVRTKGLVEFLAK